MFYSLAKRKMLSKITVLCVTVVISLILLSISPRLQQSVCVSASLRSLTYICGQATTEVWSLFHHLGGNGPWISRASEGVDTLPLKCAVDQVHMISRHAERFPTANAGARHLALLKRLHDPDIRLKGSLDFLKEWTYFTNTSDPSFENLTDTGPYAGTLQAFNTGKKLRRRYGDLVPSDRTTTFWSCSAPRDIETARHFANGFFGQSWKEEISAKMIVIPETAERGADTLTPGDTCLKYIEDTSLGHDRGYTELAVWQDIFTKPIASRLKADAGGLSFNALEIYSMMEMCGFELLAKGSSPWCKVFSHEEWLDYEYGRDLLHFYRAGPGNDFAGAMGWLWLNATTTLLANDNASGVYFSFVHDGDIVPLLATLGILDESRNKGFLPNGRRPAARKWKTSDVVPMGGRLIFERVTCSNTGLGQNLRRSYIRLFINDGLVDLQKGIIGGGLANSIGIKEWTNMVGKKGEQFGKFDEVCGLPPNAPSYISFLQPQYR